MQNFGRENFDDSTCIRQNSSDFSTVKVLPYTVLLQCSCIAISLEFLTHMLLATLVDVDQNILWSMHSLLLTMQLA